MKRIDERDTMFARMNLQVGSEEYLDYYNEHPQRKQRDDHIRTLPNICGEGTMTYNPVHSRFADAVFRMLGDINPLSEGKEQAEKVKVTPKEMTETIKKYAKYYGAVDVGITKMKPEYYYTLRGRKTENYKEPVEAKDHYAIVFAVEMDQEMINRAPQLEEVIAVVKGYMDAGMIGMVLSYMIRELGYEARNHMDGNYLLIAPLVAQAAGLGQIGRMGLLTSKEYGPRVRLGVVTTEMELIEDDPEDFNFAQFCEICGICSRTCPGQAIPKEKRSIIDGDLRWKISQENCYERWRSLGTDCGVCLSACPFSQDLKLTDIKDMDSEEMKAYLNQHRDKYGIRRYVKDPLDIVKTDT
ncbi:4Fe-4S dicluster domain-containing protein [Fusibacter sp. JL216-2]|uniref:4Fe-4S dicluster domain-containing protein n=1 Tax=Fusibacter sp. JL216-2 TaxID=3071453 RepID=UPI003D335196